MSTVNAYMLEDEDGNRTAVDARLLRIVQARYPEADILIHYKLPDKTAIMLAMYGEAVGAIMPLKQKAGYDLVPELPTPFT